MRSTVSTRYPNRRYAPPPDWLCGGKRNATSEKPLELSMQANDVCIWAVKQPSSQRPHLWNPTIGYPRGWNPGRCRNSSRCAWLAATASAARYPNPCLGVPPGTRHPACLARYIHGLGMGGAFTPFSNQFGLWSRCFRRPVKYDIAVSYATG
jgi:hypothetical protein